MIRRLLSFSLSALLAWSAVPPVSARALVSGEISGIALTQGGQYLANHTARVRSLAAGQVRGVASTNPSGAFSFSNLDAGVYVVELVSDGAVVGTSAPVVLSDRRMIVGGVEARAAASQTPPAAIAGNFWTSTIGIVVASAAVAGVVTAVVIARKDASPSQ
jgi:hypothetical protein